MASSSQRATQQQVHTCIVKDQGVIGRAEQGGEERASGRVLECETWNVKRGMLDTVTLPPGCTCAKQGRHAHRQLVVSLSPFYRHRRAFRQDYVGLLLLHGARLFDAQNCDLDEIGSHKRANALRLAADVQWDLLGADWDDESEDEDAEPRSPLIQVSARVWRCGGWDDRLWL